MLKNRVVTAVIILPIVVWCILGLPWVGFAILSAAVLAWGAWEWGGLLAHHRAEGNKQLSTRFFYLAIILICFLTSYFLPPEIILFVALIWWLIAIALLFFYSQTNIFWGKSWVIQAVMGILALVPCWIGLNVIHFLEKGNHLVLFILVVIWCADTGAYFTGKQFGKVKLLPEVSPKKTVEGAFGGLLSSMIAATLGVWILKLPIHDWPELLFLTIISVIFSIFGDLLESAVKRQANCKDSGSILPGHGGMLDRIDSMLSAVPIFALGLLMIGK